MKRWNIDTLTNLYPEKFEKAVKSILNGEAEYKRIDGKYIKRDNGEIVVK